MLNIIKILHTINSDAGCNFKKGTLHFHFDLCFNCVDYFYWNHYIYDYKLITKDFFMYMKEFYMYVQLFLLSGWLFLPVSRRINHQKFLHVRVQPFLSLHGRQHLTPLSEGSIVGHHHVPLHRAATLRCPFCWQHLLQARKIQKRKVLHTRHTKLVCGFMFLFEKNHEYCPWKEKKKKAKKAHYCGFYLVSVFWGANSHPRRRRPLLLLAAASRAGADIVWIFQSWR